MKTGATNKRVRELISMVRSNKIVPKPEFQRRLVWTQKDKDRFIDTVLKGLPFPEIYLADGDVDLESGEGTQLLVDGLQRVSTLIQYFEGDPELKLATVPPYGSLPDQEKKAFLQYEVAVRDLGGATKDMIIDVFQRINATKYSLNDIEINNAVYAGALKQYAADIGESDFFKSHGVFTSTDYKRMGDLRFALSVVGTLIRGYFNRDDAFEELLDRYNDDFPLQPEVDERLQRVFAFIDECGFEPGSRAWKKADLFTLIVELDHCFVGRAEAIQPSFTVETMEAFYGEVEKASPDTESLPGIYYKAALQASNDRVNRMRRGAIVGGLLEGRTRDDIERSLRDEGLMRSDSA